MEADIHQRIRRIYAAIDANEETDLTKFKANVLRTDKLDAVYQDFRGGLTDDALFNLAHMLIHNIANLRDHLRKWAARNGKDKSKVDEAVRGSIDLQLMIDLCNSDKHGYPPRNGGCSGKCPRLISINRVMRLRTHGKKGSTIGLTLGLGGVPQIFGDGTARIVIVGDVVDGANNRIGEFHDIARKAVKAWEQLLVDFGLGAMEGG